MKAIKILLVDDDLKYAIYLKRILKQENYHVYYAGNGSIALEQFSIVQPDLILLDINMPGLNGFEVAEYIRLKDKHVLIFFLSDRSEKSDRLKGFRLQANDYLPKPFYPEELVARIRDRFNLNQPTDDVEDEFYQFGQTLFNYNNNEIITPRNKTVITTRQADILRLLAKNLNKTVQRSLILETIWGDPSYANSLALNVQITYIRRLLQHDPSIQIRSIARKGYLLEEQEPPIPALTSH